MEMENEKRCSGMCCVLSFLTGIVVGGGIALLTAPKSGKETRRQLMGMVKDVKWNAENYYDEAAEKVEDHYRETKRTVDSIVDTAKKTFHG